jgi:hypothetical protein
MIFSQSRGPGRDRCNPRRNGKSRIGRGCGELWQNGSDISRGLKKVSGCG